MIGTLIEMLSGDVAKGLYATHGTVNYELMEILESWGRVDAGAFRDAFSSCMAALGKEAVVPTLSFLTAFGITLRPCTC
jgi:hypothetical protein